MAKTVKGKTPSGFKFEISERRLNNYELLELIGEVDEGNGQAFPKVLKLLFGDEYGVNVYSTAGQGTDVEITIPTDYKNDREKDNEERTAEN